MICSELKIQPYIHLIVTLLSNKNEKKAKGKSQIEILKLVMLTTFMELL